MNSRELLASIWPHLAERTTEAQRKRVTCIKSFNLVLELKLLSAAPSGTYLSWFLGFKTTTQLPSTVKSEVAFAINFTISFHARQISNSDIKLIYLPVP